MDSGSENRLTVVGGASIDTIERPGGAVRTVGGAGLYATLAARRASASVTMIAPKPSQIPSELERLAAIVDWKGSRVDSGLPRFDISYDEAGRRRLRVVDQGGEADLDRQQVIRDLASGPVYVAPLTDVRRQLEFALALKASGRWVACGTYPCGAGEFRDEVLEVYRAADAFFCNEQEAESLFGTARDLATAAGKLLFVTRGSHGVTVYQGSHATDVKAVASRQEDPTGAGDGFCGATLAALMRGEHPVEAARLGVAVAAQVVGDIGPRALYSDEPPPPYPSDPRVELDRRQISILAGWLESAPDVRGFDFCGDPFPDPRDPGVLDYFFAQTLQQFGFWRTRRGRYQEPMVEPVGGELRKGSDFLWFVYRRLLETDPEALTPKRHKELDRAGLDRWYRSDDGENPVPASDLHWRLARSYGNDLMALDVGPRQLVDEANASRTPIKTLLCSLDHVGGYKEDPLRKKSALLAMVLQQRPERLLRGEPGEEIPPIVDYHIQRSCLRMGLVQVSEPDLLKRLESRVVLDEGSEEAVRRACYRAVCDVRLESGRSMAAIDWFFFQNRRRCPEMKEPECSMCEAESVCAKRTGLFQPVLRTTYY